MIKILLQILLDLNGKRYALFLGYDYYPNGGVRDMIGVFKHAGDAEKYLDDKYLPSDDGMQDMWVHIVDTFDMSIVAKCTVSYGVRNDWSFK